MDLRPVCVTIRTGRRSMLPGRKMPEQSFKPPRLSLVATILVCIAAPVVAELADVYLKNGLRLRGDVTQTADEVIVRNAAGEVRFSQGDVERVVLLTAAASQPVSRPTTRRARPTTQPREPELPPAPPLSDEDIQRLKLMELTLDGPPDTVKVRFLRKGKQRELPLEVLDELRTREKYDPAWEHVLTRGTPAEKLQLIVRETGLTHADRIVLESDPPVFEAYRRRVLPLVVKSCGRSGCHAGQSAHEFRLPLGSATGETYAYTTFVLLNDMQTSTGPLINRSEPEASVLLGYLLPREGNRRPHPAVTREPTFKPTIQRDDRHYNAVADWINDLAVPPPNYGLEYANPYPGRRPAPATAPAAPPQLESPPHETEPTGDETQP